MNEKRFDGTVERLRAPERMARLEVERVVDLCLETNGLKSVLDVGVGSGIFAEVFARRGLNVTGVDVNPEMITAARRFVPKGEFRVASADLLPFHDDQHPSFSVNDKENYWHCFAGCGGGSIIDFWMKWRGIGFVEVINELEKIE